LAQLGIPQHATALIMAWIDSCIERGRSYYFYFFIYFLTPVLNSRGKKKLRYIIITLIIIIIDFYTF